MALRNCFSFMSRSPVPPSARHHALDTSHQALAAELGGIASIARRPRESVRSATARPWVMTRHRGAARHPSASPSEPDTPLLVSVLKASLRRALVITEI